MSFFEAKLTLLLILLVAFGQDIGCFDGCRHPKLDLFRCGDKCLTSQRNCFCGDITLTLQETPGTLKISLEVFNKEVEPDLSMFLVAIFISPLSGQYCCNTEPCKIEARNNGARCSDGIVLNLTKPCHGQCNDYQNDTSRNGGITDLVISRSHPNLCSDNKVDCIAEDKLCKGAS